MEETTADMATIMAEIDVQANKGIKKDNKVILNTGGITDIMDQIKDIEKGGTIQISHQCSRETAKGITGTTDIPLPKAIIKSQKSLNKIVK